MMTRKRIEHGNGARAAFTLVELLVVISIVVLLIALLLPALKSAKDAGKAIKCSMNLHQVYVAFAGYANEYREVVPPNYQFGTAGWWTWYWKALGDTYLGPSENYTNAANGSRYLILKCPAETGSLINGQSGTPLNMYDNPWVPTSYAMNVIMNYAPYTPSSPVGFVGPAETRFGQNTNESNWSISFANGRVYNPSDVDFMMDCPVWTNWGWINDEFYPNIDTSAESFYAFRHPGGRANIVYFDGHTAGAQHFSQTGKLVWSWKYP